jgi:hypothetical protein
MSKAGAEKRLRKIKEVIHYIQELDINHFQKT